MSEFSQRDKDLTNRKAQPLEPMRAKASDRQLVIDFIEILLRDVKKDCKDLSEEDCKYIIYNMDETSVSTFPKTSTVWCQSGQSTVNVRDSTNKYDSNSLIICGSSSGSLLNPMIIFRASKVNEVWTH